MAEPRPVKPVEFDVRAPGARQVYLCGTFNGWNPTGIPMRRDESGCWHAYLRLPRGTYEYRVRVDGRWMEDPGAQRHAPNPFGGFNSLRDV